MLEKDWISVKWDLPKKGQLVLVQDVLNNIYIGKLYDPDEYTTPYFVNVHNQQITTGKAWMPLPEPPKGE